ncbi:MAG: SRPBCC family protein [Woeseia sp.]
MDNRLRLLLSSGLGAAAMYYLDPARGRYRRALVRDQLVHQGHKARHGATIVGRDSRNRSVGIVARLRSLLDRGQPDDVVLVERVRACLGRVVSHPHSVKVEAQDGVITLSGYILQQEVPLLLDCALGVPGVRDLKNQLDARAEAGSIPGLQGTPRQRPGTRSGFQQENWSPTARAAAGLAGLVATMHGFGQRTAAGKIVGAAGMVVLTRALTNMNMGRLFGIGAAPRHAVDVQKSIHIRAPVEKVFELWDNFDNFPLFMTHVRRVRRLESGEDRTRWCVTGPTGTELEFDAVLTERGENHTLAWRTEGDAFVQHAGRVRFQGNDDGSTTVHVRMTYNPVAGAVGHVIAWLLGADPKHQMDDDLLRMKSYLETGKLPHDAAEQERKPLGEASQESWIGGTPRPEAEQERPPGH